MTGKTKTKKTDTKDLVTPYEPTPCERAAMAAYVARKREKPLAPRMKVSEKGGVTQIAPDHPEAAVAHVLLMEAIGAKDVEFLDGLLKQLLSAGTQGRTADERGLNFMLSVVKGIEPKDQVEAMLAAQMAAVHMSTMTFARRLAHVENIPQQDSAERAFNKLARTFAAQVEALKRYRSRGEQTVRVEHVTVNEGGQAIVGNVSHGGRGSPEKMETSRTRNSCRDRGNGWQWRGHGAPGSRGFSARFPNGRAETREGMQGRSGRSGIVFNHGETRKISAQNCFGQGWHDGWLGVVASRRGSSKHEDAHTRKAEHLRES